MKKERQKIIIETVIENEVNTQEQLIGLLREKGVRATQATLSRDIRELKLSKKKENGAYRYSVPRYTLDLSEHSIAMLRQSVIKVDRGGAIAVLHTHPGMASAAAASIDSKEIDELIGTIAGDDTVFALFRSEADAEEFMSRVVFTLAEG